MGGHMQFHYTGALAGEVNPVLDSLVNAFIDRLGANLKGLYLHGSMAMGCFRPWTSDIDLLAVVHEPMDREIKLDIVHDIMGIAEGGREFRKVEFSVVTADAALRATHPIPYILHYSDTWHQRYQEGNAEVVIAGGTDGDLAAHFMVIRRRGVALHGATIEESIGEVLREDYLKAVWHDIRGAETDVLKDPAYVVLNLCRTLMYLMTDCVGSKLEGGRWGLARPELAAYAPPIRKAIAAYTLGQAAPGDAEALRRFASDMLGRIREYCPLPRDAADGTPFPGD
jgi:predicted nucleotidyltransferase